MAAMSEAQEHLKNDSTPLQEMLLAADAVTRGEMSQADYDAIAVESPQQQMLIGGFGGGAQKKGETAKPLSLVETEKQVEKQIKSMEALNSLIDLSE